MAAGLLFAAIRYDFSFPLFNPYDLLVLSVLFLFAKASILPAYDPIVFITFFAGLVLTLFLPLFQVILFLALAFILLKVLRVY
ncbi:hypothetical protein FJZ40_01150 [Candidatus Shapirobacteria bacterium]|nr:hypothetical protein [Candidatus Shapirobacteria bacterium]